MRAELVWSEHNHLDPTARAKGLVNRRGAEVGRFVYAKSYMARGVSLLAAF